MKKLTLVCFAVFMFLCSSAFANQVLEIEEIGTIELPSEWQTIPEDCDEAVKFSATDTTINMPIIANIMVMQIKGSDGIEEAFIQDNLEIMTDAYLEGFKLTLPDFNVTDSSITPYLGKNAIYICGTTNPMGDNMVIVEQYLFGHQDKIIAVMFTYSQNYSKVEQLQQAAQSLKLKE